MKPPGLAENDPQLRKQTNEDHLKHLTPMQRANIRAWAWVTDRAEAMWLRANGWRHNGHGWWLLPEWHPKRYKRWTHSVQERLREKGALHPDGRELYDQSHAANSQRYYIRAVQTPPTVGHKPTTRGFDQLWKRYAVVLALATICSGIGGLSLGRHAYWIASLFFLAAALCLGISLRSFWLAQRELEFDWVEERLRGKSNGIQRGDQTGRGR